MNTALIMIGSNDFPEVNIPKAILKISTFFPLKEKSACVISTPIGKKYKSQFHNLALKITCKKNIEETVLIFKTIETEMGRLPSSKENGVIPIDIDLIFWNGCQCHQDYDRFEFVKQCIDQIKEK